MSEVDPSTKEPWKPELVAYGTPGGMFEGAARAVTDHQRTKWSSPDSIAMSRATRSALFREFFPNHEAPEPADGDLIFGTPIAIDDELPFGLFRTQPKEMAHD